MRTYRRLIHAAVVTAMTLTTAAAVAAVSEPSATAATAVPGSYVAVPPTVVADTRTGAARNHRGAIAANHAVGFVIAGKGHIPTSGAAAVRVSLTVFTPRSSGALTSYAYGTALPGVYSTTFVTGRSSSSATIVTLGSGRIVIHNRSAAAVQIRIQVVGYYRSGTASTAGAYVPLAPVRAIDTRPGAGRAEVLSLAGKAHLPTAPSRVYAVLTARAPAATGSVRLWADGAREPTGPTLSFAKGRTVSVLVTLPVSTSGRFRLQNRTSKTVEFYLDIVGYTLRNTVAVSRSHYIRSAADLTALGAQDAATGSKLVVLHIGAQLNDMTGVQYSATNTTATYEELSTQLQSYLNGFGSHLGAVIAIATNNDASDWTGYPAQQRGTDWAAKVIDPLLPPAGVRLAGADDIESEFVSNQSQALSWQTAFLAATSAPLVFVGSANGCPTTYGSPARCSYGWTQAQIATMAGATNPSRAWALPQIYNSAQAAQWANLYRASGRKIHFLGALTEHAAVSSTFTSAQAYQAFNQAFGPAVATPPAVVTDLSIAQ